MLDCAIMILSQHETKIIIDGWSMSKRKKTSPPEVDSSFEIITFQWANPDPKKTKAQGSASSRHAAYVESVYNLAGLYATAFPKVRDDTFFQGSEEITIELINLSIRDRDGGSHSLLLFLNDVKSKEACYPIRSSLLHYCHSFTVMGT
eukprot:g24413.t1